MKSFISKENSKALYGIAIFLMLFHHMFGFPDRVPTGWVGIFNYKGIQLEVILAPLGRICIAIYAFISGYGMMYKANSWSCRNTLKQGYKASLKHLVNFYAIYWLVFLLFIPYGFLSGNLQFSGNEFVKNLLGISSSYNAEWWYVSQYVKMLIAFPIFALVLNVISLCNRHIKRIAIYIMLLVGMGIVEIVFDKSNTFVYLFCFMQGMICVQKDINDIWNSGLKLKTSTKTLLVAVGLLILFGLKCTLFMLSKYDYLLIILLVWDICMLLKAPIIERTIGKALMFVGQYSIYMWLIHTFFIYYYFQNAMFISRYSVVNYIWATMVILGVSILLSWIYRGVKKLIIHLKNITY